MRLGYGSLYNPKHPHNSARMVARWAYFQVLLSYEEELKAQLQTEVLPIWSKAYLEAYPRQRDFSLDQTNQHIVGEVKPCSKEQLIVCLHHWLNDDLDCLSSTSREAFLKTCKALYAWRNTLAFMPPLQSPERDDLLVLPALYALSIWLEQGLDAPLEGVYKLVQCQGAPPLPELLEQIVTDTCGWYNPEAETRGVVRLRAEAIEQLQGEPLLYDVERILDKVEAHYQQAGWQKTIQLRHRKVSPRERFEWTYFRHVKGWTYTAIADYWNDLHAEQDVEARDSMVTESDVYQRVHELSKLLGLPTKIKFKPLTKT